MSGIISFLESIGNAIVAAIGFVISFFGDVVYLIQLLAKAVGSIPEYLSWLPGELVALVMILIAVVMIYKILGREG